MNLRQMAEHMYQGAKEISLAGQEVNAAILIWNCRDDVPVVVGMPEYGKDRAMSVAIMKAALEMYESDRFAFVCEAWMAMKNADDKLHKQPGYAPSRDPERISAIVVIAKHKNGEHVELMCEIKGSDKTRTFEEIDTSGQGYMVGILDNLFGGETVQ